MKLYRVWMVIAITIICILSFFAHSNIYQVIASVAGVIYVIGVAQENKFSIFFGIINAAIYGVIMFLDKIYGTAIYDVLYCIPVMIYTFFTWSNKSRKIEISTYSVKQRCKLIFVSLILVVFYYLISTKLGVNYALADAVMIILGAFGMYITSKKKIEQWYFFIATNISNIILWLVKCNESISNLPLLVMWFVYLINNCYGLYTWYKKLAKQKENVN